MVMFFFCRYSEILDYHNVDSANGDSAENGDSHQ